MPGVHRPCSDTWLLADALRSEGVRNRAVADVCTGSGALALVAARAGAARVFALDVSRRALLAARLNARVNGCAVSARRGDLLQALDGESVDVIVCNPPYVPTATDALPRHRSTTALDGGRDGRVVLERVCRQAPHHLRAGGAILLVHSSVCGVSETCRLLGSVGLPAQVIARAPGGLGPVMRARAPLLRERGLLGDLDKEELVVVRGRAGA